MATPSVKVTLYIARHGECSGNQAQKFMDPFTDNLTAVGLAQAELLGTHLQDVPFTAAFASDYPRAEQTAKAVLAASNKAGQNQVELKTDSRLRERGYTGILGVHAKDAVSMMHASMKTGTPYLAVEMDNCETVQEFEGRIIDFFLELISSLKRSERTEETVLIASHGLTIQRLMILFNTRPSEFGISSWTSNPISERQMRNTTYHKVVLDMYTSGDVIGYVEAAHCRDHIDSGGNNSAESNANVKDTRNYAFLDGNEGSTYEKETIHYCMPV